MVVNDDHAPNHAAESPALSPCMRLCPSHQASKHQENGIGGGGQDQGGSFISSSAYPPVPQPPAAGARAGSSCSLPPGVGRQLEVGLGYSWPSFRVLVQL